MRAIVFIPIFLRVVVSLSTSGSPNNALPVSVMDRVLEQRSLIQTATLQRCSFNESVVEAMKQYEIPAAVMIDYCEATTTWVAGVDRVLELNCKNYEKKNRALRQHFLVDDDLVQASNNYERILELPVSTMIEPSILSDYEVIEYLKKEWVSINRGKDLFLTGMGGFNIPQAYGKAVSNTHTQWKKELLFWPRHDDIEMLCSSLGMTEKTLEDILLAEQSSTYVVQIAMAAIQADICSTIIANKLQCECISNGLPYWFVRVSQLQAWGYFGNTLEKMKSWEVSVVEKNIRFLLALPKDSPQRQHFIQYHHSWSEQENLASLDEIRWSVEDRHVFWPDGWKRMKPSTLLNSLREHARKKELAQLGGDTTYSHLSDLRDSESLRVLRSSREVMNVGLALKNCALTYAEYVEHEECILIAKYDDVQNKPIALGMIYRDGNMLAETWSQIYLSCNRAAPEEVKQEFYDYETVLRPWFRKKYATEQERLQ